MENVRELYAYVMRHYEPGDRIFLFGFSRGAFTARALAGMIHVCGLLNRDDEHLLSYAAGLYQTSERRIGSARRSKRQPRRIAMSPGADHAKEDEEACRFKERLSRPCDIHFLGLWDTVKAYGWFWPQSFPALWHNPSVQIVRHAVSLHERRSSFQVTGWGDRRPDVKEVWFRGDHSDVGGGHDNRTALSDATLGWMLAEATTAGLRVDRQQEPLVDEMVAGGRSASSCASNSLNRRWFRLLNISPRLELDNRTYPPRRWPKSWPTGKRWPPNHTERDVPLRFHETVSCADAVAIDSNFVQEATGPIVFYDVRAPATT